MLKWQNKAINIILTCGNTNFLITTGNVERFSFYVTLKSIDMWKHELGLTVQ